jgi:hypothetical protein
VNNLRLKSDATFWKSENAESMLQVRSQVIPDQWDQAMVELSNFRRTIAHDGYQWTPQQLVIAFRRPPFLAENRLRQNRGIATGQFPSC